MMIWTRSGFLIEPMPLAKPGLMVGLKPGLKIGMKVRSRPGLKAWR
jgi:hypothetical protein